TISLGCPADGQNRIPNRPILSGRRGRPIGGVAVPAGPLQAPADLPIVLVGLGGPLSEVTASMGDQVQPHVRLDHHARGYPREIVETLGLAAATLLRADSWEECVEEMLSLLGEATAVSRALVFDSRKRVHGATTT